MNTRRVASGIAAGVLAAVLSGSGVGAQTTCTGNEETGLGRCIDFDLPLGGDVVTPTTTPFRDPTPYDDTDDDVAPTEEVTGDGDGDTTVRDGDALEAEATVQPAAAYSGGPSPRAAPATPTEGTRIALTG